MRGKDITGNKYERLIVLSREWSDNRGRALWLCKCDCGNQLVAIGRSLRYGKTKSCGCYKLEVHTKHGECDTRLYSIWKNMRTRCKNPGIEAYQNYGGRGIVVSPEWDDFTAFRDWALSHGYEETLTLDRMDNDGNYEPPNCRWTTWDNQQHNKRLKHNNKSGICGVFWDKKSSKWRASIGVDGQKIYLGLFDTKDEALLARKTAEKLYWQEETKTN